MLLAVVFHAVPFQWTMVPPSPTAQTSFESFPQSPFRSTATPLVTRPRRHHSSAGRRHPRRPPRRRRGRCPRPPSGNSSATRDRSPRRCIPTQSSRSADDPHVAGRRPQTELRCSVVVSLEMALHELPIPPDHRAVSPSAHTSSETPPQMHKTACGIPLETSLQLVPFQWSIVPYAPAAQTSVALVPQSE